MMTRDTRQAIKLFTQIFVSLVVLAICAVLILYKYPEDYIKWAFGVVGVIIGYWLS